MNKIAQIDYGGIFGSPFGRTTSPKSFGDFISFLLNNAPIIAGVLLLVGVIAAGISVISSAGKDDPQGAERAKQTATWALVGFLVIFAAFWIIRIIEVILGVDFITNPGI